MLCDKNRDCLKELSAEEQKQLNLFALLQAFSRTSLLPYIKEKAKELDLKIVLDKAFVDEIAEN